MRYDKIICPKCGKSYFKVRDYSSNTLNIFDLAIFIQEEAPIYKDGILQNPKKPTANKAYFECLECGDKFRVEYFNDDDYVFIDEIKEQEEIKQAWAKKIEEQNKQAQVKMEAKKETKNTLTTFQPGQELMVLDNVEPTISWVDTKATDIEKKIEDYQKQTDEKFKEIWDKLGELL